MLNRRQFLLGVGGGATLLGLSPLLGCSDPRRQPPLLLSSEETWATSICQLCPAGCGLRVRLVNGNPVTLAGNPLHPVNRGGLCARGAAGLQLYYDPDRLAGPMVRDRSVVGGWAPLSWKDALDKVTARLQQAVTAGRGRVAVIRGDGQDITSQLLGRLARAAGSDWVVDVKTPADRGMEEILRRMHGTEGRFVYDLTNASFLLSLDSGLLETSPRTMSLQRSFADMRSAGGQFVHAAPRLGVTGAKADTWLPIRPATAGVLALGVAHMLIKEGYARTDFLRNHVDGYEDWTDGAGVQHPGLRSWILSEFSTERVADLTGVGLEQIIQVARRFGSARQPLALGPVDGTVSPSTFDLAAVHALNVIAGAIDVPGGILLARKPPFDNLDEPGEVPAGRRRQGATPSVEDLATWVLGSKEPPIDVCFVHEADPVFSSPLGDKVEQALRKIPLVVSTSPVVTDTVEAAGLVLPGSLWLERRVDTAVEDGNAYPVVALAPAAARPRADSRNTADVVLTLARGAGGRVADQFPWSSYDEVVAERMQALFRAGVGDTFAEQHRSTWAQLLERSGWRTATYKTVAELEKNMEERGGWWDPIYYHQEWRRLAPVGDHRIQLQAAQFPAKSPVRTQIESPGNGELFLYLYAEPILATRTSGSLPYLQDLGSPLLQPGWVTSAEINPETAKHLGIAHGDRVKVESELGALTARVCASPGIRPDVLAVHTGGGRTHGGRYAAGIGSNPLRLAAAGADVRSDRTGFEVQVVRVERLA